MLIFLATVQKVSLEGPHERLSLDEVVAKNLRRIRDRKGWSRKKLAELAAMASADEWPEWRIIDLEGARSGRPPSSAKWPELVTLSYVLDVTLWELVLPEPGVQAVVNPIPPDEYGVKVGNEYGVSRSLLAERLSGLPARLFEDETALRDAKELLTDRNLSLAFILSQQEKLDREIKKFTHKLPIKGGVTRPRDESPEQADEAELLESEGEETAD